MLRRLFLASPLLSTATVSAAVFATAFIAEHAHSAPTLGQKAPEFSATDTTGKPRALADFKGKYVVLEWVNPNCPFVKKHYNSANMQGTQKDALGKGNVVWLAINSTEREHPDYMTPAQLNAWMKDKASAPTAMLMDEAGSIGKAYGARTTPHLYIVNPQGALIYAGGIDSIPSGRADDIKTATNYVKQGLAEALAGKPLTAAATQPYGCSVKYKSSL